MEHDAFSAGVNPGGLRSKQEIKILICFILKELRCSLKKSDITAVLQNHGLANYFEASEAFSELVDASNIMPCEDDGSVYCLTSSGEIIAHELSGSLPASIKEKSLTNTKFHLERTKSETENKVSIKKNDWGYSVSCNISGGEFDMLSLTLYAPDIEAASLIKDNFYKNPSEIYHEILLMLTKSDEVTSGLFNLFSGDQSL